MSNLRRILPALLLALLLSINLLQESQAQPGARSPGHLSLPAVPLEPNLPGALLTVGSGCTYPTLQAALNVAANGDIIYMEQGVWVGDANGKVTVSDSVTIYGGFDATCTNQQGTDTILDGTGGTAGRVMTINANLTVGLSNIQLINGDAAGMAGGGLFISSGSNVALSSSVVRDNEALNGAGIRVDGAILTLEGATAIYNNDASSNGGGINCEGGTVYLRNVSIGVGGSNTAGAFGGGVYLDNCDLTYQNQAYNPIESNSAQVGGGIYAGNGSLVVIHTNVSAGPKSNTATGNGGGIHIGANSELSAHGAHITGNDATYGGGLYVDDDGIASFPGDTCNVSDCGLSTIAGNSADYGGAIYVDSSGYLQTTGLLLENNRANVFGSALYTAGEAALENLVVTNGVELGDYAVYAASTGSVTLNYSTLYDNGDNGTGATALFGVIPGGVLTANGIITWNNYGAVNDAGGGTVKFANSLLQFAPSAGSDNLIGQDPLFDGDYHLQANSPAIDYVTAPAPGDVPFDIDREPRPNFGSTAYDAGADEVYELIGINGNPCAYSTIAAAVAAAVGGDVIYMIGGAYNENIGLIDKELTFAPAIDNCTLLDPGADSSTVIVDGSGFPAAAGGVAEVQGATVTFRHMTLQEGTADFGGALYASNSAHIILDDTDVMGSHANFSGGGVRVADADLTLQNGSRVIDNTADQNGGGVAALSAALSLLDDSRVGDLNLGNHAAQDGGGIYLSDSTLSLQGTAHLRNNTATNSGGGIYSGGQSIVEMSDQSILGWTLSTGGNSAPIGAGARLNGSTIFTATGNSRIQYNVTSVGAQFGGGIAAYGDSRITLDGPVRVQNNSASSGGGIYLYDDANQPLALTLLNGVVVSNNSATHGGGLYSSGTTAINLTDMTISENIASSSGGGVRLYGKSTGLWLRTTISDNDAADGGGLVLFSSLNGYPELTMQDMVMEYNTATGDGGAVYNIDGQLSFQGSCSIAHNDAGTDGGAFYTVASLYAPQLRFSAIPPAGPCFIAENTAANGAGFHVTDTTLQIDGAVEINSNVASGSGGGLYAVTSAGAIAQAPTARPAFRLNQATAGSGGAAYLLNMNAGNFFDGVDIAGNTAGGEGGGIYADNADFNMRGNIVENNEAGINGGGLAARNASTIAIMPVAGVQNCYANLLPPADHYCSEFRTNRAGALGLGGAIYVDGPATTVAATETAFIGNRADYGAAVYTVAGAGAVSFTNSRFSANDPGTDGVFYIDGTGLTLNYSTLAGNAGAAVSIANGAATVNVSSSIIWDNTDGITGVAAVGGGGCNISQNGIGGPVTDPLFTTTARGDYHLGVGSPAINACLNGPGADLDLVTRPQGGLYDMGAFEACGVSNTGVSLAGDDVVLDWGSGDYTVYRGAVPYALGVDMGSYLDTYTHVDGAAVGGTAYYYIVGCASSPQVGAFTFSLTPGS